MDRTFELIKLAQAGDITAKELIIKENLGLIWSVVRRFSNRGHEAEDLFQIGSIGLIKCIDKFDMSFDVKFSTYAVPMIMGEIKRFLRDDGMIKISRSLKESANKAKYMQEQFQHQTGRPPTINELAEALQTTVEELALVMESGLEVESLFSTVNQKDGSTVYLLDKLSNGKSDEAMVDKIALKQIISQLNPKERQVIIMRYFQDKTQTEIAEAIGVSQVQVSRIEKKVLKVLREKLT